MKKNIPLLFFGLAVVLGSIWGLTELIMYQAHKSTKKNHGAMCTMTKALDISFENQKMLDASPTQLATYAPAKESVLEYRIGTDRNSYSAQLASEVPLRCVTPDYNCLATVANGGPRKIEVVHKVGPALILSSDFGARRQILPALMVQEHLQLATSMKICGLIPDTDATHYFMAPGHVGYFDESTGRLGIWDITSYPGALSNEAAREPNSLFRLSATGFQPSHCDEAPAPSPARIFQVANKILLYADVAGQTMLKSYSLELGFSPEEIERLSGQVVENIWPLSFDAVIVKLVGEKNLTQLRWSLTERNWSLLPVDQEVTKPLNRFSSPSTKTVLASQSGYFMSPEEVTMYRGSEVYNLPDQERQWRRTQLPASHLFEAVEEATSLSFLWAHQQDQDIKIHSYDCEKESKAD